MVEPDDMVGQKCAVVSAMVSESTTVELVAQANARLAVA